MPFVVVLSIIFLKRKFSLAQYLSVLTVIAGLAIVTLTDIFGGSNSAVSQEDSSLAVAGFFCMVVGQVLHASQGILEEYILKSAGPGQEPCYMSGWEGVFGLLITVMIMVPA